MHRWWACRPAPGDYSRWKEQGKYKLCVYFSVFIWEGNNIPVLLLIYPLSYCCNETPWPRQLGEAENGQPGDYLVIEAGCLRVVPQWLSPAGCLIGPIWPQKPLERAIELLVLGHNESLGPLVLEASGAAVNLMPEEGKAKEQKARPSFYVPSVCVITTPM